MALQAYKISELVEKINHGQQQLADGDTSVRLTLLQLAWNLAQALEEPYEGLMRMTMVDVSPNHNQFFKMKNILLTQT